MSSSADPTGATAAVAAFGAILVIDGSLTVGALAATILLAGRVLQPLFQVRRNGR